MILDLKESDLNDIDFNEILWSVSELVKTDIQNFNEVLWSVSELVETDIKNFNERLWSVSELVEIDIKNFNEILTKEKLSVKSKLMVINLKKKHATPQINHGQRNSMK